MIRAFVTTLVLLASSASFAANTCNTQQTLNCRAVYVAYDNTTDVLEAQANYADENAYEPSLSNCAATVYFKTGDTTVRVYASQDLATTLISYSAQAIQASTKNGARSAEYSSVLKGEATPNISMNLGSLQLPNPIEIGTGIGKTVYVGCSAK
jgi:hypothetical protein